MILIKNGIIMINKLGLVKIIKNILEGNLIIGILKMIISLNNNNINQIQIHFIHKNKRNLFNFNL